MSVHKWDQHVVTRPILSEHDQVADRRREAEARLAEEIDRKQAELVQLRAATNTVHERIRLWERRFGLDLPVDPDHRLLACVAEATGLTLAEVREEQRQRAAAR